MNATVNASVVLSVLTELSRMAESIPPTYVSVSFVLQMDVDGAWRLWRFVSIKKIHKLHSQLTSLLPGRIMKFFVLENKEIHFCVSLLGRNYNIGGGRKTWKRLWSERLHLPVWSGYQRRGRSESVHCGCCQVWKHHALHQPQLWSKPPCVLGICKLFGS